MNPRNQLWTPDELKDLLTAYKAAYLACASGKSYTIGSRTLTRQDISEITSQLEYLQSQLKISQGQATGPILVKTRIKR